jgi:LCP family protein required for cell wall assembly
MKTTLKRGVGRSAASNGNGHGVLPPDAVSAIRRYEQPPRRRTWGAVLGRILLWLVIASATVGAGLAGGAYLYLDEGVSEGIQARSPDVKRAAKKLNVVPAGQPAIALAIGYDRRAGVEAETNGARSDTVMLLKADPRQNVVTMLSFPRDLIVDIYCPGKTPFANRINEAYSVCGAEGTLETVRKLTGLPVNYLVTVNFRGFKQMVAKIGGVWLDVDRRYFNDNSQGGERYATIDLQAGYQKLNGSDSLDYVRYRHLDNDFYRLARQQLFMQAFKQAVTTSFSAEDVPRIVSVLRKNVEVGAPGDKAIGARTLISYGLFAYEHPRFIQTKIPVECFQGLAELHGDPACIQEAVDEFANPDVGVDRKATDVALGRKPKPTAAPTPKQTTVVVLNGNAVPGSATNGSFLLSQRGYRTVLPPNNQLANAPVQTYFDTKIYFNRRHARSQLAARDLARLFGGANVGELPRRGRLRELSNEAMLVVVVGKTFTGTLAASPVDRTPERKPPQVYATDAASSAMAAVRRQAGFRLMAPRMLAKGYVLSSSSPVRVYKVANHGAARMTFTNGVDYFGVQAINWKDAPILSEPHQTVKLKDGRRYHLYYSGAKLRMVVVRHGDASYWIVNTLTSSLSNETMLEMAKSLALARA